MTRILTIIALLFATPAWAEQENILAADDLKKVFSMSEEDWEANATSLALAGLGRVGGKDAISPSSLTISTEYGVVETAPFYFSEKLVPDVVFIRVGMNKNILVTKDSLTEIYKLTKKQLSEDGYTLKTRGIDEVEDGYWLTFAVRPPNKKMGY